MMLPFPSWSILFLWFTFLSINVPGSFVIAKLQHICHHDQLYTEGIIPPAITGEQVYNPLPEETLRRLSVTASSSSSSASRTLGDLSTVAQTEYTNFNLLTDTYKPIRIHSVFTEVSSSSTGMSTEKVKFLQDKLVPATATVLQNLLSVDRVQGKLYAYRECMSRYTAAKCAEFAKETQCGSSNGGVDDDVKILFPTDYYAEQTYYAPDSNSPKILNGGTGIPDTDFTMFVTAKHVPSICPAEGKAGTLAYALTCQRDQYDRPTFGRVNFCPYAISTNVSDFETLLAVAVHEYFHALGFASSSWPLFRNWDSERTPKTPRNNLFVDTTDANHKVTYTCNGNTYKDRSYADMSTTIDYFAERGMSKCTIAQGGATTPNCVHKFIGNRITAAAREHFACPTLNGAELENHLTTACTLQGSHWEQRIFNPEIMTSFVQPTSLVSAVTLAVFEESGWYKADYSKASVWRAGLDWGYKQGCDFALKTCLDKTTGVSVGNPPHFSSVSAPSKCTTDRRGVGAVTVNTYTGSLPTQYQYFSNPRSGGNDYIDYCPFIEMYSNRHCDDVTADDKYASYYGESYGPDRACFETTTLLKGVTGTTGRNSGCMKYNCSAVPTASSGYALTITAIGPSKMESLTCYESDSGKTKDWSVSFTGSITCPNVAQMCAPSFPLIPSFVRSTNNGNTAVSPSPSASMKAASTTVNSNTKSPASTNTFTASNSPAPTFKSNESPSGVRTSTVASTPTATYKSTDGNTEGSMSPKPTIAMVTPSPKPIACGSNQYRDPRSNVCVCLLGYIFPSVSAANCIRAPRIILSPELTDGVTKLNGLTYSMNEGTQLSVTVTTDNDIPLDTKLTIRPIVMNVTSAIPWIYMFNTLTNSTGVFATEIYPFPYTPNRIVINPSQVELTNKVSSVKVSLSIPDNTLVETTGTVVIGFQIDSALTTATDYTKLPFLPVIGIIVKDNDSMKIMVSFGNNQPDSNTGNFLLTDSPLSSLPFMVNLAAAPLPGTTVTVKFDDLPGIFLLTLFNSTSPVSSLTFDSMNWKNGTFLVLKLRELPLQYSLPPWVTFKMVIYGSNGIVVDTFIRNITVVRLASSFTPTFTVPSKLQEGTVEAVSLQTNSKILFPIVATGWLEFLPKTNPSLIYVSDAEGNPIDTSIIQFSPDSDNVQSAFFTYKQDDIAAPEGSTVRFCLNILPSTVSATISTSNNNNNDDKNNNNNNNNNNIVQIYQKLTSSSICSSPIVLIDDDIPGLTNLSTVVVVGDTKDDMYLGDGLLRIGEGSLVSIKFGLTTKINGKVSVSLMEELPKTVDNSGSTNFIELVSGFGSISPDSSTITLTIRGKRDSIAQGSTFLNRKGVLVVQALAVSSSYGTIDTGYTVPRILRIPFVLMDTLTGTSSSSTPATIPEIKIRSENNSTLTTYTEGQSFNLMVELSSPPLVGTVVTLNSILSPGISIAPSFLVFDNSVPMVVVKVTVLDDDIAFGNRSVLFSFGVENSTSLVYGLMKPVPYKIFVIENDLPSVLVSQESVTVLEGDSTDKVIKVKLSHSPPEDSTVTVSVIVPPFSCAVSRYSIPDLSTSCRFDTDCPSKTPVCRREEFDGRRPQKVIVNPSFLIFSSANYSTLQTITVSAPVDGFVEGDHKAVILLRANSIVSPIFTFAPPSTVNVQIEDADTAEFKVEPYVKETNVPNTNSNNNNNNNNIDNNNNNNNNNDGIVLREGMTSVFIARLTSFPLAPVFVNLNANRNTIIVDPPSFIFMRNETKLFSLRVIDDKEPKGTGPGNSYTIPAGATLLSIDSVYNFTINTGIEIIDNDLRSVMVGGSTGTTVPFSLRVVEGTLVPVTIPVRLTTEPESTVDIFITEEVKTANFESFTDACLASLPTEGSQFQAVPGLPLFSGKFTIVGNVSFTSTDYNVTKFINILPRPDRRIEDKLSVPLTIRLRTEDKGYLFNSTITPSATFTFEMSDELFSPPPKLPEVYFSDDYTMLIINTEKGATFLDTFTPQSGKSILNYLSVSKASTTVPTARLCNLPTNAAEVTETLTLLGSDAVLFRNSSSTFVIMLGRGATVAANDNFILVSGKLRTRPDAIRSTNGNVAIKDAKNPITPMIKIAKGVPILNVSSCDTIIVPASISGTGGRSVSIQWTAGRLDGGVLSSFLTNALTKASTSNQVSFVITNEILGTGITIRLTATVTNFRGIQANTSVIITRASLPTPRLSLSPELNFLRSMDITVKLRAELASCDKNISASTVGNVLRFYWFDTTSTQGSSLPTEYFINTPVNEKFNLPYPNALSLSGNRLLSFGSGDLEAGTYYFTVYVVPIASPTQFSVASVKVTVQADPLVAQINGGAFRDVTEGEAFTMDASESGEPTALLRSLQGNSVTFAWECDTCSIDLSSETSSTLDIAADALAASENGYVFTVTVSSTDGRSSVSASQTVRVISNTILTPVLTLDFGVPLIQNSFLPETSVPVIATAVLSNFPDTVYTYDWSLIEGTLTNNDYLSSVTSSIIVLDPSIVTAGSFYILCVTASSEAPVAQGTSCIDFSTFGQPSVGDVKVVNVEGTTSWSIEISYAQNVEKLLYMAITADNLGKFSPSTGGSNTDTVTRYAVQNGPFSSVFSLLDSRTAAETAIISALLPPGNVSICVFGVSLSGSYDVHCTFAYVPPVVLSTSAATALLTSTSASGEPSSTLAGAAFVAASSLSGNGRRLQGTTNAKLVTKGLLSSVLSAYSQTTATTGNELPNVLSTLSTISTNINDFGDESDKVICRNITMNSLTSMNGQYAQPIKYSTLNSAMNSLTACGMHAINATVLLADLMADNKFATDFATTTMSGVTFAGSSGVRRKDLWISNFTVKSRPITQNNTRTNPSILAATGSGIVWNTNVPSMKNLTTPIEVRVSGMPTPSSTDRTAIIDISFSGTLFGGNPSKNYEAVYIPSGTSSSVKPLHDGTLLYFDNSSNTYTIYSTHNSTFTIVEGTSANIVVSTTSSTASVDAVTLKENDSKDSGFYVRLSSQPDYDVTVDIVMPSGVCYYTNSGNVTSKGTAMLLDANKKATFCTVATDCLAFLNTVERDTTPVTCADQFATVTSSTSFVFTTGNWNIPQTMSIKATADKVAETDTLSSSMVSTLQLLPFSQDSRYDSVGICTDSLCSTKVNNPGTVIQVTVIDTDIPSVTVVTDPSPSFLSESTSSSVSKAFYYVKLTSKPVFDVTVTPTVTGSTADLTASPATLTFTSSNWNIAQTIDLTVNDDNTVNGERNRTVTHTVSSTDTAYGSGNNPGGNAFVSLTIKDNDVPTLNIGTLNPSLIFEDGEGNSATFTVQLNAMPSSPVTLTIVPSAENNHPFQLTISGTGIQANTLLIEPDAWNIPVTVTVTSTSDGEPLGTADITLTVTGTCNDNVWKTIPSVTRVLHILDTDGAGIAPRISSATALVEGEDNPIVYTISLLTMPTAPVYVDLSVVPYGNTELSIFANVPSPITVQPSTLVFTGANFSVPQTVQVNGVDDSIYIPSLFQHAIVHRILSTDTEYKNLTEVMVAITVTDNDVPEITLSPSFIDFTSTNTSFLSVSLTTKPVAQVTIDLSTSAPGVILAESSVVFTKNNWNIPRKVTIVRDDFLASRSLSLDILARSTTVSTDITRTDDYAFLGTQLVSKIMVTLPAIVIPEALPSPSPSPVPVVSPSSAPSNTIVSVALTLTNVDTALVIQDFSRTILLAAFSQTVSLPVEKIQLRRILEVNGGTKTTLWTNPDYAGIFNRRRLELNDIENLSYGPRSLAIGNVVIDAVFVTSSAAQASSLSTSINSAPTTFSTNVLNQLINSNTIFNSVTATVANTVVGNVNVLTPGTTTGSTDNDSNALSMGAIIGIIIAAVVIGVLIGLLYLLHRGRKATIVPLDTTVPKTVV